MSVGSRAPLPNPNASPFQKRADDSWLYELCVDERRRRRAARLFGGSASLFVTLVGFYNARSLMFPYDRELTLLAHRLRDDRLVRRMGWVSAPGNGPLNLFVAGAIALMAGWRLGWRVALYIVLAGLVQGSAGVLLKLPIRQERPFVEGLQAPLRIIEESSFPSGHVVMYVVLFGFGIYLLYRHSAPRAARAAALGAGGGLIALVGPARILAGVHWVGDIVAGYLLGAFILLLTIEGYERYLLDFDEPAVA